MVKIELIKPIKLTSYSLVMKISFNYDAELLAIIKQRNVKAYNAQNKSWEIALFEFKKLIESLDGYEIEYIGTSSEEILKANSETKSFKPYALLKAGPSIKLKKRGFSLFVSCPYNVNIVSFLKEHKSLFHNDNKVWEVDLDILDELCDIIKGEDLTVRLDSTIKEEKSRLDKVKKLTEKARNRDWDAVLNNYNFITKPYTYQLDGIRRGLQDSSLLLTDEQGLGKTLQALYTADIKAREEEYKYTLIVCGVNGLKYNWLSEIEEHLGQDGYILGSRLNRNGKLTEGTVKERIESLDKLASGEIENRFIVTNIETLRDSGIKAKIRELCLNGTIGMVIIDEMHRVSNIKSKQGDALNYLNSRNKIGLTGTPLVNKPFDLYAPLRWLGIEKRNDYEFRHRYGKYATRYGQGREYEELIEHINLGELKDILNTVMLRREKKDVLDLPEVVYVQEFVEMSKDQSKLYNGIRKELIAQIEDLVLDTNPLAKFTRLRQACSCPGVLDSSIDNNPKYSRVLQLIDDLKESGQKAIVYSNFAQSIYQLNDLMKENDFKSYVVTGEEKNKKAVIDKFKVYGDVLLGSIQALGTGYTITEATTIIFLDLPWTYAAMIQAVDRAHRIGQKNNITVISLLANDTVDSKIYKIVKKKQDLFEDLMEGKDIKGVNRKKLTKSLLGI